MTTEVALVTGAGSGIGAATARALAGRGARVVLVDRDAEGAAREAAHIEAAGGEALAATADVTADASMAATAAHAVERFGAVTTVVAAAGIETLGTVTTVSPQDWARTLDVNLTGVYLTARHTVPLLEQAGGGSFIAISSDAGVKGSAGYAAYSATKHAVIGLIKCMALDHGPEGVRSNVICPGFVMTPMAERIFAQSSPDEQARFRAKVPLGRFAQVDDVAAAVLFLSSPAAQYSNGVVYMVDGGSNAGQYDGSARA